MRWQEGSLFFRSNAWHARFYCEVIVDGTTRRVQRSKRLCDGDLPKKQVHKKFAEFMGTVNEPGNAEATGTNISVVKFWDDTYLPFITENLKHSTLSGYKQIWKKHLKPHFGTRLLNEYRTPMGTVFITGLSKTLRPRTVQHIRFLASGLFAHAIATGACETNPWHDVKVLGKFSLQNQETEIYTLEEIADIISALVEHVDAQLVMALAYFAGMRKSEIAGLQWNDIDGGFIHVRRAVVKGVVGTPKTKKSVRSIPIIAPVQIPLLLWRKKNPGDGWVFKNADGERGDLNHLLRFKIIPVLLKNNLRWRGLHSGRRGLGTKLREITGNSNAGRDLLGHTTDEVTKQHYEGEMPEEVLKGMKLLEAHSKVKK